MVVDCVSNTIHMVGNLFKWKKIRWEINDKQVMIFTEKSIFKDKRFKGFKTHIIHKVKGYIPNQVTLLGIIFKT